MDVVVGTDKILGSAQRRRRGAVLQHGSLVLRKSEFAPQFPGLFDLASTTAEDHLLPALALETAKVLGEPVFKVDFEASVRERAQQLRKVKYTTLDWSRGNPLTG